MRWDDITILRELDRQQLLYGGGPLLSSALDLMNSVAGSNVTCHGLIRGFVQELHNARDGAFLTFEVHDYHGPRADPDGNPHYYLQQVRDLSLTTPGRDRARSQVVLQSLPDPDEDDGRLISSLTLGKIADVIAEEYSPTQIPVFLKESGIPLDRFMPDDDFSQLDVRDILTALAEWGSEGRRILRRFVGQWLSGQVTSGPTDNQRAPIVAMLARRGWHVRDGNVVIGEFAGEHQPGPLTAPDDLHPWVWDAAKSRWQSGHRRDAIVAAAASLNDHLQHKVGRQDVSDDKLIQEVFSDKAPEPGKPRLRIPGDPRNLTVISRQQGALQFGLGCFRAIRNPAAHETREPGHQEALEQLAGLSVLARLIDGSDVLR
jgi:Protein of unknown function (Hypoth_ymh)